MKSPRLVPCPCPLCQQDDTDKEIRQHHAHLRLLLPRLDEQQRRWLAGLEAIRWGHGGELLAAAITGLSRKTVRRGRREVLGGLDTVPPERIRQPGAGRKSSKKNVRVR